MAQHKATIKVDKEKVMFHIRFKYGTIEKYLKAAGITRMRFWQVLNQPHLSKEVKCLQDLAKNLEVSIETILM